MIQRIQSLFLLVASGSIFAQFGLPYLQTPANDPARTVPVLADGVFNPFDNIGILGLTVLAGLASLLAIFLFRNRSLQTRFTIGALLSSGLLLALAGFTAYTTLEALPPGGSAQYQAGLALPVVALLFQWLAGRSIRKDEQLVRSVDRLR
ncbi:MAG: DUF4293 domain-containing protein [Saprospiraceae bacterium]|nr:DUF4293 domain-containing protein [Saprospiraceae bacterium]